MFKCPKCGGDTKVKQTVNKREYGDMVVERRLKCKDCGTMFLTNERFERYTEEAIRKEAEKAISNVNLQNFLKQYAEEENAKVSVQRDQNRMINVVMKSSPINWDEVQRRLAENGQAYGEVGVIPPEVE